jgi:IS5 family transposase
MAVDIRTQQRHDKNKLYALLASEVECIGKGKARKLYEFGVKVSLAVTHKQGLMVGARAFPGNPFDGHTLAQQLEQTTNLLHDLGRKPKQTIKPMMVVYKIDRLSRSLSDFAKMVDLFDARGITFVLVT